MGKVICVGEPERKVRLHDGSCGREVQVELTKIRKWIEGFSSFFF
jgi:hypothetical protein